MTFVVPTRATHQNNKAHQLGIGTLPSFTGDDVPLLWGANNDLCGIDFFFTQLVVPSQFGHRDSVRGQALRGRLEEG